MRIQLPMFLAALALSATACSKEEEPTSGDGKIRVSVCAPEAPSPLTAIGDDGVAARWEPGDRIGLWAASGDGDFALEAEPFTLWHYGTEYPTAVFSADINPMPSGNYTYYALYPAPAAAGDGTVAEYEIPAVQDGTFDGSLDLMAAVPVQGQALQETGGQRIELRFRHLMHVLKITIPENKNLAGAPLTGLEITFPAPVVGRVTVDAAAETPTATLTQGKSVLRLEFAEPVDAGATVWAVIAPADLSGGELVFKGLIGKRESKTLSTPGRLLAAGHTTPIALTIPELFLNTRLNLSLGKNNLGEAVQSFTLTVPEGGNLGEGSNVRTFAVNDDNHYEINFEGAFTDNLSGLPVTVTFDSENALVTDTFVMPQLNADENNDLPALDVPYLFAEDFSGIAQYDNGSEWKGTDPNNTAPSALDECGLTGWTGSRTGVAAGTSLRISCNTIIVFGNPQSRRQGRVDTAPLTGIKPGKTPSIRVSYTYCGALFEGVGSGGNILASAGYTRQTGGINSSNEISNIVVPETSLAKDFTKKEDYYDKAGIHDGGFDITGADADVRLSWRVTTDRKGGVGGNGCYWLYIDNIKVQIVQ